LARITSLTIELRQHLRRVKPDKHLAQLAPRSAAELVAAADVAGEGRAAILLDTNVYIRDAAGTLPAATAALVDRGLLFHCSVCIAELSTGIANEDPSHAGWKATREHYAGLIASFPPTRVLTPDPAIWTEAGLIAGTLARTQSYQRHQRKEALNDALIFLTAAKAGLPVLTADRDDFDLIQQLAPRGRFVHF
jgi:predicted nucleic acid-binding protein